MHAMSRCLRKGQIPRCQFPRFPFNRLPIDFLSRHGFLGFLAVGLRSVSSGQRTYESTVSGSGSAISGCRIDDLTGTLQSDQHSNCSREPVYP